MSWRYSVFGLAVASDSEIPGLAAARDETPPDLRIETATPFPRVPFADGDEHHVSRQTGVHGKPLLRIWRSPDRVRFLYDDGAEFLIDDTGRRVWARWPDSLTLDDVGPYLCGPILGFVLRLRGVTALHASAVEVGGGAVVFVGPPGAGKSTLAAAFARLGHAAVSDDVVALGAGGDRARVLPGYPWIRLWSDSVEALFGDPDALPRIAPDDPDWQKRFLDLERHGLGFAAEPLPLRALYLLANRSAAAEAPFLRHPSPAECLLNLAGNTYMNYVLDAAVRARELETLGHLARSVPVSVAVPHVDAGRLARLCELLLDDLSDARREGGPAPG